NKEYKITIEQLNDVYQKFIAFHDEIDLHPNIKVIKNFIDNYSHKHPYFDVDQILGGSLRWGPSSSSKIDSPGPWRSSN
ncbi:MAG: hypothetical protein RLZZ325_1213, partial [Pseudomonadota bacterium]